MKDSIRFLIRGIAVAAVIITLLVISTVGRTEEYGGWSFNFSPFAFCLGLEGDVATLPSSAPADVSTPGPFYSGGDYEQTLLITDKEVWFDPIFGITGYRKFATNWYLSGWAVAAVGGESDSVFDVFGGVGYRFNDLFSLIVG